ncbi:MAG: helix-turn-helix domain-containing protein [Eubacteriales bacterium]|nr:helix-turn-helix domain-containing protein [Eubacteriales bacterium]
MITYKPFYATLLRKNVTEYELIFKHGLSANTIHRIKHGQNITLKTLDTLCSILDCKIGDIVAYTKDE